jgi:signal transduction histidine kinase
VLQNLVDNASYSPDGPPSRSAREDAIVFWVQDYGIGISEDELPRIFERFYQVDQSSTRTFRGAGLGLSLVQDLLRHLGGTIEVRSVRGEGSRFTVNLPVRHPGLDRPMPTDVPDELTAGP